MWLSSSRASSPSSCLQDNSLYGYMDVKIDACFIYLLSTPSIKSGEIISTKVAFFDGSIANPIEEASLVLDQRIVSDQDLVFHENLEEKETERRKNLVGNVDKSDRFPVLHVGSPFLVRSFSHVISSFWYFFLTLKKSPNFKTLHSLTIIYTFSDSLISIIVSTRYLQFGIVLHRRIVIQFFDCCLNFPLKESISSSIWI
ncbi:hypothetical protein L2E82_04896 [Cichorium intybus]|uniref:Uncharacterized protein n=1 Tax=Cichorium intybus TaxID=13427 RepID=A0ACB9H5R9_CICIN|nr:hypothetical protein L2E82_04896 [Cichorium intybus]